MTPDLRKCPAWLTADKVDGEILKSFCWERKDDIPYVTPETQDDLWHTHRLVAFSDTGWFEFNKAGELRRAKCIHLIEEGRTL